MALNRAIRSNIKGAALALGLLACLAPPSPSHGDSPVLHAPPIPFTWQLSPADETRLYQQVKTLRYGDSLMSVKARLGEPTLEQVVADKRGDHRALELKYAIRRVHPEGGNSYDQEISLIFGDESHRLLEVWYSNMAPLSGETIQVINLPGPTDIHATVARPPMP